MFPAHKKRKLKKRLFRAGFDPGILRTPAQGGQIGRFFSQFRETGKFEKRLAGKFLAWEILKNWPKTGKFGHPWESSKKLGFFSKILAKSWEIFGQNQTKSDFSSIFLYLKIRIFLSPVRLYRPIYFIKCQTSFSEECDI